MRASVAFFAAVLLLAACGGGDDGPDAAEDRRAATEALLKPGDFPNGWTEGPEPEEDEDEGDDAIDRCLADAGEDTEPFDRTTADIEGAPFSRGLGETMTSTVTFFEEEETAVDAVALFENDDFLACAEELLPEEAQEQAGSQAQITGAEGEQLDAPDVGDGAAGLRFVLDVNAGGTALKANADIYVAHVGRGVVLLSATNLGPIDDELAVELLEKVTNRLEN